MVVYCRVQCAPVACICMAQPLLNNTVRLTSAIVHTTLLFKPQTPFLVSIGPAKTGQLSSEVVTGCAIKKGESDPVIMPDAEYPAWLFELMTPEPTVAELERMYASEGLTLPQVGAGNSGA